MFHEHHFTMKHVHTSRLSNMHTILPRSTPQCSCASCKPGRVLVSFVRGQRQPFSAASPACCTWHTTCAEHSLSKQAACSPSIKCGCLGALQALMWCAAGHSHSHNTSQPGAICQTHRPDPRRSSRALLLSMTCFIMLILF